MRLWLDKIHLDLRVNWKLSRNETLFKENFIVNFETPLGILKSEIAPNVRYGESVDGIKAEFDEWIKAQKFQSVSFDSLEDLLKSVKSHSLRFGLESVLLSYLARLEKKTLGQYLALPNPIPLYTSISLPIMPIADIKSYLLPLKRFKSLKVKVNPQSGKDMLLEIRKYTRIKLRIDANEGWRDPDDFLVFLEGLKGMNIELIEQPFPSSMVEEYKELKKICPYKILADESIEDTGDFEELSKQFHAINIKLMKTGSLIKAKKLLVQAKRFGLESMIGCMIETSLGISYGMLFGGVVDYVDLDGYLLLKKDPFQLVSESEGILTLVN